MAPRADFTGAARGMKKKKTNPCRKAEVGWTGFSDGETTAFQKLSMYS